MVVSRPCNPGRSISRDLQQVEVVETPDNITRPRSARDGRVQRRIHDHLRGLQCSEVDSPKPFVSDARWFLQQNPSALSGSPSIALIDGTTSEGVSALWPGRTDDLMCLT
jgi:hypothetical protein